MNHEYTPKFLKRFWDKIDCTSGLFECWIWTASKEHGGHGQIRWHSSWLYAHRVAYELAYGPFPEDLDVLHKCDNPSCCNPTHLFLGTQLDNMKDMVNKNRQQKGENHYNHKLSDSQVQEIRRLYALGDISQYSLAKTFGVSQGHIGRIVRRNERK